MMIEPYYKDELVTLYCGKCEEILPQLQVRADLLLTDPPYGIDVAKNDTVGGNNLGKARKYGAKKWDESAPDKWVLNMLQSITDNQIIFGGNYFAEWLGNTPCWIIWDKDNSGNFADCEIAWTSFDTATRIFKWRWNGMLQENMAKKEERFHPTQKPLELMKYCLTNYAERGQMIIDPYAGSGVVLAAAKLCSMKAIGIEQDEEYCRLTVEKRLNRPIPLFDAAST